MAFVQNRFAVFFYINNIGVDVGDDGFGSVVLALDLNLDVQLFRNLCKLHLDRLGVHQSAGLFQLLGGDAVDDLQLLFRLRNDGADGHRILDAD